MPMRRIQIVHQKANGIISHCSDCRNDPHAEAAVDHTLVTDGRYLVSPIQSNKAPKFRDRTCVFLKPRRTPGGICKARVRFEDDGSEANIDPGDLLPYEGKDIMGYGTKGLRRESSQGGPISAALANFREIPAIQIPTCLGTSFASWWRRAMR